MKNGILIIILTINLFLIGSSCAEDFSSAPVSDIFHDPNYIPISYFDEITLERGSCLAACPIYKIVIQKDGNLYYEGKSNVLKTGLVHEVISQDKIDELVLAVNQAEYSTLSRNDFSKVCESDAALVKTSLKIDNKEYKIAHYGGTCGVTGLSQLNKFENDIDEIVNVGKWVETLEARKKNFIKKQTDKSRAAVGNDDSK